MQVAARRPPTLPHTLSGAGREWDPTSFDRVLVLNAVYDFYMCTP